MDFVHTPIHPSLPPSSSSYILVSLSHAHIHTRTYVHRWYVARKIRCLSLGKLTREETSVLAAKLRLFCPIVSYLLAPRSHRPLPPLTTSFCEPATHPPSIPPSSSFANYPSPGTLISRVRRRRTRQEERDLSVFAPFCSQPKVIVRILRLSTHIKYADRLETTRPKLGIT